MSGRNALLEELQPPAGDRAQVLAAELYGWTVTVWRRESRIGTTWDATASDATGARHYRLAAWATLERTIESLATLMSPSLRLSPRYVAATIRAVMDAETRD